MSVPTAGYLSSLRKQGSKAIRHLALGSWTPTFAGETKYGSPCAKDSLPL